MNLLAIDVGTTHCKVGLFAADGTALAVAARPTVSAPLPPLGRGAPAGTCYDPEALWASVAGALAELAGELGPVAAVGISSMAETGLLLERRTGRPRTPFLPWFDTNSAGQAARIARRGNAAERFRRTGLHPSHKCGLARLLWLRDELGVDLEGCTWLSVADYLAYRLTGRVATDYTLAARTQAFHLDGRAWDEEWLRSWDLDPGLFPPALPGDAVAGRVAASLAGLAAGLTVRVGAGRAAEPPRAGYLLVDLGVIRLVLLDDRLTPVQVCVALADQPVAQSECGAHVVLVVALDLLDRVADMAQIGEIRIHRRVPLASTPRHESTC